MMREKSNEYNPDTVSPPWETLQEALEERGWDHYDLACKMGIPDASIFVDDLVEGVEGITPWAARLLEKALGIPASFWLNREQSYCEFRKREGKASG